MNEKEIAEINMYCDSSSILVVTNKRRLVRLRCPFQVIMLSDVDNLKKGETAYVDAVKINSELQLVYVIRNKGYHYTYCKINFIDR